MTSEHPSSPRGKPSLSVLVPVTERARPLADIYRELKPVVEALGVEFEFVFVISPWGTELAESLKPLREAGEPIRVLELGHHTGESAMLAAAASQLKGDVVLTIPTYRRIHDSALAPLVDGVASGEADVVSARRVMTESSLINRLQNWGFHKILRMAAGGEFRDIAFGVRAVRRSVLEEIPMYGDFFRFLPILARAEGFRVQEVEVPQHEEDRRTRIYGPGIYVRRLLDLFGLFFLVRFTQKPLRFFGLIGAVLSMAGGAVLLVMLIQRMGGKAMADRPLLLLGVLFVVLGFQAIGIGLVGEIIVHFNATGRRLYRTRPIDR